MSDEFAAILVGFVMGAIAAATITSGWANDVWRESARKAGVGKWVQKGDSPLTEFRWVEPASKQAEESEVSE